MSSDHIFADPLTERLVAFVRGIGIDVRTATLPEKTILPGLDIRHGAILVDEARMTHPGDILHEAGIDELPHEDIAHSVNVHNIARREVSDGFPQLGRAVLIRAAIVNFALGPDNLRVAFRTPSWHLERAPNHALTEK